MAEPEGSAVQGESKTLDDKIESAIYGLLLFVGNYLRTARDFFIGPRLLYPAVGSNRSGATYTGPATFLSLSVVVYLYLAIRLLESKIDLPPWFPSFATAVRSLEIGQIVLVAPPLAMVVALFALAFYLSARALHIRTTFAKVFALCAYAFGTSGVLGLLTLTVSYSLIPFVEQRNFRTAYWIAVLLTVLFLLSQIWLLFRYLLSVRLTLSLTWMRAIVCYVAAIVVFSSFLIVLFPGAYIVYEQVVPPTRERDFAKLLSIA